MAGDKPMRGVAVAVLAPAFGQHKFFLRFQHRKPPDFFQIPGQTGFARQNGQCSSLGHDSALHILAPAMRRANRAAAPRADGASFVLYFAPATYTVESGERK